MASSHRIHFFHVVWSTKNREDLLLPKIQARLYSYMGGVIRNNGGILRAAGGIANHVHLLIELSHLDGFSGIIRDVKARSSAWLKNQFVECSAFRWQEGYGSFSVSYSQLERVRLYIERQEEHHATQTFEDEYMMLLRFHNANFKEEYVFN